MGTVIRKLAPSDAGKWLELLKASIGEDYADKALCDVKWAETELTAGAGAESWGADVNGQIQASICFLPGCAWNQNPIANLGRNFFLPESFSNGAAEALMKKVHLEATDRGLLSVIRVLASDNFQQILLEKLGYICAGFQPFKHMVRSREGCLFYLNFGRRDIISRQPVSESLPQVSELAAAVLGHLQFSIPAIVKDGATGYPLKTEIQFHAATSDDFELWKMQAEGSNPAVEISGGFNIGHGFLRTQLSSPVQAFLGQRENQVVAGISYFFDERDRSLPIVDCFALDDVSLGAMLQHAMKAAHDQLSAVYVEVDILMTAPRLLKSAEQLGFVPVAYLPAFYSKGTTHVDVVKMVKLNLVYSAEKHEATTHAKTILKIVDQNFNDQKIGLAIINLLRGLPVFDGLGDGELRKIARLFTQKLYRPADRIFNRGDVGNEAYVVMRGQIDIVLEDQGKPLASVGNGQIFGEQAFLDGAPRGAHAVAGQASILLVIQRSAFHNLVHHEPHLGMVVMRNIAMELSNRLRRANVAPKK